MSAVHKLITDHLDIWTAADTERKSGRGRTSGNANSVYGIKKLRELILELAVRGKLVPQDQNDEPASELLKRIGAEQTKLIIEGKVKKTKPLSGIVPDELPFSLPENWRWSRLGTIGYTQTGGTPSKSVPDFFGEDYPFIKPGDIYANYVDYGNEGLSALGAEKLGRIAPANSLLMVCIGTIGKCNVIEQDCVFNQQINSITPYLFNSRFLLTVCRSQYFNNEAWARSSSTTIAILNKGNWEEIYVPIPPFEEQHRIVAKVDELMALCDQLEAQHNNAADAHEQLVSHLLSTLTQSQDAADFNANWQRIATHFDTLFTTESSIDALKQTLLQLAVMGKLVPQDPNDEPASELIKRINESEASNESKSPAKTKATGIDHNKIPFDVPNNWRWEKLGNLISDLRYGTSAKCEYELSGVPVLRIPNIGDEGITLADLKFGNLTLEEQSNLDLKVGDALLIRSNGSASLVGKTALVSAESTHCAFAGYLVRLRIKVKLLLPDYFQIIMKSSYIRGCIEGPIRTTSGVKNINSTEISNLYISVPPISEQYRIAAKVEELMSLCEQLKSRIVRSALSQQKLVTVLLERSI